MTLKGLMALIGLAMIGVGAWQVFPPAAWIVVGTVLFVVALLDAILEHHRRGNHDS